MVRLIVRRLALGILTIVLVSGIIFVGVEALPGDTCTAYLGRAAQGTRLDNCRRDFGLERPALTRYAVWALGAVHGDFGVSLKRKTPISEIVGIRFRNTVILGTAASMVGVPLAILLGVFAALWRDRPPDQMSWMARPQRAFVIDLSRCPRCGGEVRVIATVTEPNVIARILAHLQRREHDTPAPREPPTLHLAG